DLDSPEETLGAQRLTEKDGRRVSLLTRCGPGAPDPDVALPSEELRNHIGGDVVPGRPVPEKVGDVDQDLVEQDSELFGVHLKIVEVGGEILQPELAGTPAHAPRQAVPLVSGEVKSA